MNPVRNNKPKIHKSFQKVQKVSYWMKKPVIIIFGLIFVPVAFGLAAESATITDINKSTDGQSVEAIKAESTSGGNISNTETTFETEEGVKPEEGDPDKPIITGSQNIETVGIEHEDIGAPSAEVLQKSNIQQRNETDLEFLRDRASGVSVSAVEIRGWNPQKKEEFLVTVKEHAELQSEQDLENFATGVLLKDKNIKSAELSEDSIDIEYSVPAKFLGIFNGSIKVNISAKKGGEEIETDKYGRVKVKFPWYRFLFRTEEIVRPKQIKTVLNKELVDLQEIGIENNIQRQAQVLSIMSDVMKSAHDTATNIIRNLK